MLAGFDSTEPYSKAQVVPQVANSDSAFLPLQSTGWDGGFIVGRVIFATVVTKT